MVVYQITLNEKIEAQVLAYLQSLEQVIVKPISPKKRAKKAEPETKFDPQRDEKPTKKSKEELLKMAARPIRKGVTLEQIWIEQGSKVTDWDKIRRLAKEMDIQEPLEELLAQLTP